MTEISAQEIKRLPCRGCTSECKNYESCGGQLWRQPPAEVHEDKAPNNK